MNAYGRMVEVGEYAYLLQPDGKVRYAGSVVLVDPEVERVVRRVAELEAERERVKECVEQYFDAAGWDDAVREAANILGCEGA